MASWSVYMRDPAAYGFQPILDSLPDPVYHDHEIAMTPEQRALADELLVKSGSGLFDERLGIRERTKMAQLARGFLYRPGEPPLHVKSRKPGKVAELVRAERALGRPTIVACNFDEEARILHEHLADVPGVAMLHGDTPQEERPRIINAFRHDDGVDVLISKAQLIGKGLNLQRARAMVESGIDDSFEARYQFERRAIRFGQTHVVHVHRPFVPELEGLQLTNLNGKEARFMADVAAMEGHYTLAMQELAAGV
jgi:SNF2 family DNA or RNA helicase